MQIPASVSLVQEVAMLMKTWNLIKTWMSKAGKDVPSVADGDMDGCIGDTSGLVVAKAALPQDRAGA